MLGRRQAGLVALVALFAVLSPSAPAGAAGPAKVKPAFAVTSAAVSAAKVRFAITVAFATPAGGSPAALCRGPVVATTRLSKRRRASWQARLAATATGCQATVKGSLPKRRFGAKVSFAFAFAGTPKLHAFAALKTLKLSPPAAVAPTGSTPSPAPAPAPAPAPPQIPTTPPTTPIPDVHLKGKWATDEPTSGPSAQYMFTITADNVIPSVDDFGGSFKWYCGPTESLTYANFDFQQPLTVLNESAGGTYSLVSGMTNVVYKFDFKFTSPTTGTGSFSATGVYDYGVDGPKSCHVAQTFTLYHYV